MIYNINARKLTDDTIFVQYLENGLAKDENHINWEAFTNWLMITLTKVIH